MKDSTLVRVSAIIGISLMEAAALATGHDGVLFSLAVGAVSAIAGYTLHGMKEKLV